MQSQGMGNNTDLLLQYYEEKVQSIVTSVGKKAMFWEDVVESNPEGKLAPGSLADCWNTGDWQYGAEFCSNFNQSMILSGCFSLDSWEAAYNCEPYNFSATLEQKQSLMFGGHGSQWGEGTDSANYLTEVWPNACGIGERLWSPYNTTSASAATFSRLVEHRCRYVQRGIPAVPIEIGYCPWEYVPPVISD